MLLARGDNDEEDEDAAVCAESAGTKSSNTLARLEGMVSPSSLSSSLVLAAEEAGRIRLRFAAVDEEEEEEEEDEEEEQGGAAADVENSHDEEAAQPGDAATDAETDAPAPATVAAQET